MRKIPKPVAVILVILGFFGVGIIPRLLLSTRSSVVVITILLSFHAVNYIWFRCYWERLKKNHKGPSIVWPLWWKPYFNHRLPLRVLKFQFGTEQIRPNIIERLFLPLLVRIPYFDLFNNPIIRLSVVPMLVLFEKARDLKHTNHYQVDLRVFLMLFIGLALHFASWPPSDRVVSLAVSVFVVWRIVCMISYNAATVFFQHYRIYKQPASMVRSLIILFFGYLELVLWFSLLYLSWGCIQSANCENILKFPIDSIYFSMVTITTLGYGDFRPAEPIGRVFVFFEVLIGVVYVLLVIADYIQRTSGRGSSR